MSRYVRDFSGYVLEIDVYPVGWLDTLLVVNRMRKVADRKKTIRSVLRKQARYTLRYIRNRQWRELKNEFNGYLAEPYHLPPGLHRIGSGWTKSRALRSLEYNVALINKPLSHDW